MKYFKLGGIDKVEYAKMTCKDKIMYVLRRIGAKLQEHEIVTEWARITGNEPFRYSESCMSRRLRELMQDGYIDDMGNKMYLFSRIRPGKNYNEYYQSSEKQIQEELF